MKTILKIILLCGIILISCDKDDINPTLEDFCSVAPDGWECEIIDDNFNSTEIPQGVDNPIAIIKYKNPNREFTRYNGVIMNPSLTIDFFSINQKNELIDFINSQEMYSWCIPRYYGETESYFIITSPCFINNGSFTDEANSCIDDLHSALKSIITTKDYNLIGD